MGIGISFNRKESSTESADAYRRLIAKFEDLGIDLTNDNFIYPVLIYKKDGTKAPISGGIMGFGSNPKLSNDLIKATDKEINNLNLIRLFIGAGMAFNVTEIDIDKIRAFQPIRKSTPEESKKEVEKVEASASAYAKQISDEEKGKILDEFMAEAREKYSTKFVADSLEEQGIGSDKDYVYIVSVSIEGREDPMIGDFQGNYKSEIVLQGNRYKNKNIVKIVLLGKREKTSFEKRKAV